MIRPKVPNGSNRHLTRSPWRPFTIFAARTAASSSHTPCQEIKTLPVVRWVYIERADEEQIKWAWAH